MRHAIALGDRFVASILRSALPAALCGLLLTGCPEAPDEQPTQGQGMDATATAASSGQPCAPGTQCLPVDSNGQPSSDGTSIAQCSGTFPDYVVEKTLFPDGYDGPWFQLAQNYPSTPPTDGDQPWAKIDFRASPETADEYLYALRDYAFDGMIAADFRPQENSVRAWFHIPLMNYGPGRRELVHGLTQERTLHYPELGIRQGASVSNYAIGFYNDAGGYTTGQVWAQPDNPDLSKTRFAEGTMVFKILFTAAVPSDFEDPANYLVQGAPEWQIATGNGQLTTVRLLQMDVAVRDDRAQPSGWVYGTFAFDKDAPDPVAWNRLRPVGLMWGNDPGYTPADQTAGKPLKEAYISPEIPAFAKSHLGWAGRVNGPVDNPISACMSCHSTAQYPVDAALAPFSSACKTDQQKLYWFRNLAGSAAFGAVSSKTCLPTTVTPQAVSLDTSLQMQVAMQSFFQYKDINPCLAEAPSAEAVSPEAVRSRYRSTDAPRVMRGGAPGE